MYSSTQTSDFEIYTKLGNKYSVKKDKICSCVYCMYEHTWVWSGFIAESSRGVSLQRKQLWEWGHELYEESVSERRTCVRWNSGRMRCQKVIARAQHSPQEHSIPLFLHTQLCSGGRLTVPSLFTVSFFLTLSSLLRSWTDISQAAEQNYSRSVSAESGPDYTLVLSS